MTGDFKFEDLSFLVLLVFKINCEEKNISNSAEEWSLHGLAFKTAYLIVAKYPAKSSSYN